MGGGLGEYDTGLRDLLAPIFLIFRVGRRLPLTNRELTRSNSSTYILTLAAFLNKKSLHTRFQMGLLYQRMMVLEKEQLLRAFHS